jgi:hypothetical protein
VSALSGGSSLSTVWPVTFARGRNGDVYGVNGEARGIRWDTVAGVEQLGISAPASAPTITVGGGTAKYDVVGVMVTDPGACYSKTPTLSFSASGSQAPQAKANLAHGHCGSVSMLKYGNGFTSPPTATVSAPDAAGGTGAVLAVTTSSFTIDLPGGGTETRYRVASVSVSAGGSGYSGRPQVIFSGDGAGGAIATATVSAGVITAVTVRRGGVYETAPTAVIVADYDNIPRDAAVAPVTQPAIIGKYWCAIRYIDDTVPEKRGPIPSSISELTSIEVSSAAPGFTWNWSNAGMESRVDKIELWRTTADQVLVLYKVAEVSKGTTTYADSLSDTQLSDPSRTGFAALPITLPNGQTNARRFNPPPQNKRVVTIFQDRAWYAVDVPGKKFKGTSDSNAAEPNALYFSEADEPESVPEVNQIVIQENVKGQDRVTALMPFGGGMVVLQERHAYRLSFVSQPLIDASVTLIGQRGCLNQRCWDVFDNVAYVVDSLGMYILDGSQAVPLSDPVETYWSDNIIHWASSKWFFVRVDPVSRIARFFFSVTAGFPDRALCFHPTTKAWWLETYAQTFAAAECLSAGGRQSMVVGGQSGALLKFDTGGADVPAAGGSASISCQLRTGNMSLDPKQNDRAIRVLYAPTTADCNLSLALHYNGSSSPRNAAVATDRGGGFTTTGGAAATLNLKRSRSALGDATGYAVCHYAGRIDERSVGTDRHLAVALSLSRPSSETVTVYGTAVGGVSQ